MSIAADKRPTKEIVTQIVFDAIDELNLELSQEKQLDKNFEAVLLAKSGKIDSLGLVRLIVSSEQKIEEELGVSLTLADEKAFSQKISPFKTVGNLINYIMLVLEQGPDA